MSVIKYIRLILIYFIFIFLLISCSSVPNAVGVIPEQSSVTTPTSGEILIQSEEPNPNQELQQPTFTKDAEVAPPTPTLTPIPIISVVSPLEDITLKELSSIVSNPFSMPLPGLDDGHHGVDFSYYRFKGKVGMTGLPVLSIIPGKISTIIYDRPPYGNTVIIETYLDNISNEIIKDVEIPDPYQTYQPASALNCPDNLSVNYLDLEKRSLYVLYAHLNSISNIQVGDFIEQSQFLGGVGTTGSSVNPHLHLEIRFGPSNASFSTMAHYINNVTEEEKTNYCIWRVSGLFKLIDPMLVLK